MEVIEVTLAEPEARPVVVELSAGKTWEGYINIVGILAEEESEVEINGSTRYYHMKPDEGLTIVGIPIKRIYVRSGKVKLIGFRVARVALPRMITQRSVTIYGVESAVLDALKEYYTNYNYEEGTPVDYTTTDDWADVVVIGASSLDKLTILIKNTGSNSADIQVVGKAVEGGQNEYEIQPATSLGAGELLKVTVRDDFFSQVIVRARSTTAGSPATIRIEWGGRK